ncbi:MAG: hypothetical protein RIS20_1894 [Bacteroidota bacterium]|jgi:hypothetical protein
MDKHELMKGEIADYYFSDEGILFSYSKSIKRTVELIDRNVAMVKEITGNKPVPLLIHLVNSPIPDKETQRFSKEKLPEIYSAMAMVSKPGLSAFIMKILFQFQRPPIPMKSFTDEQQALSWLKSL